MRCLSFVDDRQHWRTDWRRTSGKWRKKTLSTRNHKRWRTQRLHWLRCEWESVVAVAVSHDGTFEYVWSGLAQQAVFHSMRRRRSCAGRFGNQLCVAYAEWSDGDFRCLDKIDGSLVLRSMFMTWNGVSTFRAETFSVCYQRIANNRPICMQNAFRLSRLGGGILYGNITR